MAETFFSILIAVYNKEDYLAECLNSIINQTYKHFEVVLVDDGSTDKSLEICEDFKKKYPDLKIKVIHTKNQGVMLAKRETLKFAEGEYLIFSDADDLLEPKLLETIHHEITLKKCDIYFYNVFELKGNTKKVWKDNLLDKKYYTDETSKKEIIDRLICCVAFHALWMKAVHRDIVDFCENYNQYSFITNGDDLLQSLVFFTEAKSIGYINECLYTYRNNPEGISKKYNSNFYYSFSKVYNKVFEFLNKYSIDDSSHQAHVNFLEITDQDIRQLISNIKWSDYRSFKEHLQFILSDSTFNIAYSRLSMKQLAPSIRLSILLLKHRTFRCLYIYRKIKKE